MTQGEIYDMNHSDQDRALCEGDDRPAWKPPSLDDYLNRRYADDDTEEDERG